MSLNYLYGKLNSSGADSTDYTGGTTATAKVTVDNDSRLIYVDTKIDVKAVEAEIAQARVEIAAAKADYTEIKEKYSTFKEDIETLKNNDVLLQSQLNTVSNALVETDARLSQAIIDTKTELREDIDKVIVLVELTIQPKLDTLTAGLEAANAKIQAAETKINNVDTKVDNVEEELTALRVEVQQIINLEIAKLKADIELLKTDIQLIIETELSKVKEDITKLSNDLATETSRAKAVESTKQDLLVTGLNIKTINNTSILGSGNIDIQSAVWGNITGNINNQADLIEAISKGGSKDYTDLKFAEAKVSIDTKCDHLFYDLFGTIDPELTEVWYLMAWIDGVDTIVAGPYTLGGGGGGGSITEMTSELKSFPETVSRSATSCEIVFNWTSTKGTSKTPTGNGTIYIYVNNTLKMTLGNMSQGDNTIDILSAIKDYEESNVTVNIKVTDAYNNYELKSGTIQFVEINLTSTFDPDTIFKSAFTYACTPIGIGLSKTLNYFVDDVLVGTIENVKTSGEQVSYLISKGADGQPLKHGAHKLKVYFTCIISGLVVSSNVLNYNFMYEVEGDTTPMITSSFDDTVKQTQYISFTIPYKVYSPGKTYSEVTLSVNGEVVSILTQVRPETQYWEYRASEYGSYQMVISCGEQHKILNVIVEEAEIHIDPVTDKLALYLTAIGRSNAEAEEERKKWQYKYTDELGEEQVIEATLYNFNFSSDGWLQDSDGNTVLRVSGDAQVEIPYKIFENDFKDTGKTIEFEFATSSVMDYNTEIISCFYQRDTLSVGLSITAQEAMMKSIATDGVSSQYKEEEHIRIAFTVEKKNENRLVYMYINGVLCNAIQYPSDDSFRQPSPVNITIGSSDATTDIYCIRVYDNNLTMKLIVNNWIADTLSGELKLERYLRNNIFSTETGEITPDTLPDNLPYMIWDIDPLPQYKGDKRPGGSRYVEKLNPERNFTAKNALFNVQGTSSSVYPVKNIRIKYKLGKNDDGTLWDTFEWYDDEGNTIKKYGIRDDSIKDNYFTHKVDFASSEGVNNVELTRLYNDVAKEWKYLDPPQKQNEDIRVGVDGIPIASFWKDVDGNITFNSKANFNNDKANEDVYGFQGAWDDETKPMEERIWVGDESWEITLNSARVALFQDPVTPENFSEGFEIRYPDEDGYDKLDKLGPMTAWVSSTDPLQATDEPLDEPKQYTYTTVIRSEDSSYITKEVTSPVFTTDSADYRLIKFKAELKDWFDVNSTIFYYVFTHMFLLVDSRAKNCFPTYFASRTEGDGGDRWFWLPYDMDTAIGINNEGALRFSFNLEDTDKDEKGANVFNGQDSVMWCNLRKTYLAEISLMYYGLRNYSASRSVNFSFDDVENRFYEHLSKWPENLFNKDSQIKYIDTLVKSGQDYLEMLQGDKAQQRKWWLYNRFKYMDAKYLAGDARSNVLIFRAYGKSDMEITPFADTYINVSFANSSDAYVSQRASKGQTYHITNPLSGEVTDQETHIYGVDSLKSLGDLSGFKPDRIQADKAVHLQELKIGDGAETYNNPNFTAINVSNNTLLQYLDVRHCSNFALTIDLSNCSNIETVWCEGSSILGVTLPSAGILKSLHLPNTITKLIIKNHPLLTDLVIENISGLSLSELWVENMKNCQYDVMSLVEGMLEGTLVRLIDINQSYDSVQAVSDLYDKLDKLKGTDAQGRLVEKALIQGKIQINAIITYAQWKALADRYTDVTITATAILCTVNFMKTEQGAESPVIYEALTVEKGKSATRPTVNPTKESTPEHDYTFTDWDREFTNIQADTNVYPIYEESTRYYKIDFDTRTTKVTVPSQYIEYNGKVVEPTKPKITGATFIGWFDEQGNQYQFLTTPVTKSFTLYAKWSSDVGPTIAITKSAYNKFSYKLTDDVAIYAYTITNSASTPTEEEWEYIIPTAEYSGEYEINRDATYYVWAKDENEHANSANIIAYAITKDEGEGTLITVMNGETAVNNYCLQDIILTVNYVADSHYEGVQFYCNGEVISTVPFTITVNQAYTLKTTSTPKVYLVLFDNGQYGEKPADLNIAYNRTVEAPGNQFVQQRIIEGWYTSPTFEQETYWEFASDTVEGDMILYANWILYMLPSIIDVSIEATLRNISCNFDLRIANGVTVDWGDGSATSQSTLTGVVTLGHTYDTAGNYRIKVTCTSGQHYLGGGSQSKPVISPATVIKAIDFAWNMQYTSLYCMYGASNLKTVNISKYMTTIAVGMFQNCSGLNSIALPDTLTRIEGSAFSGCSGLTGILSIPSSVVAIGNLAFYGCTGLIGINIPESVKGIGESAFASCTGLLTFNIPYYITSLSNSLFKNCTSLSYIIIPDTVTTLGTNVFQGCSNLSSVTIMNEDLVAGEYCFDQCLNLKTGGPFGDGNDYNFSYTWKKKIPDKLFEASVGGSSLQSFVVADTIETIGSGAFANTTLKDINFPASLKTIGERAFFQCYSLTCDNGTVTLLDGLEYIGANAFYYCSGLTHIIVPPSVTYIGNTAFASCVGLVTVHLYNTVSTNKINTYTVAWFYGCNPANLKMIYIPKSIKDIVSYQYGSAWNYYTSGLTLPYSAALE